MASERPGHEGPRTKTLRSQRETEAACEVFFVSFDRVGRSHLTELIDSGLLEYQEATDADGVPAPGRVRVRLLRAAHVLYLIKGLRGLGHSYVCLDASRPWLVYWIINSLDLLDSLHSCGLPEAPNASAAPLRGNIIDTLVACQNLRTGGFGGGNKQDAHCAPTYAACLALVILGGGDEEADPAAAALRARAYGCVNRPLLYKVRG